MSKHLRIRCSCGAFAGALQDPPWVNRVICYCNSCQAFAERLGRGDAVLDAQGGSDILQTSPQSVSFTHGLEHLACLRVTAGGPLRWYASCCNTPVGNTPANYRLSFVGLLHTCLGGRESLDAAFGPPRMHVFTRSARGEPKPRQRVSVPAIAGFMWHVAVARLSGGYEVTPFFDRAGVAVAVPGEGLSRSGAQPR